MIKFEQHLKSGKIFEKKSDIFSFDMPAVEQNVNFKQNLGLGQFFVTKAFPVDQSDKFVQ